MKNTSPFKPLITAVVICSLCFSYSYQSAAQSTTENPSKELEYSEGDPVEAALKALKMAQEAVAAVEKAAQAVMAAASAIEEAKATATAKTNDDMETQKLAAQQKDILNTQEENLMKAAQTAVELAQQASRTVEDAAKIVVAARKADKDNRFSEALAVALIEEQLPWVVDPAHLEFLRSQSEGLIEFIEGKLAQIQSEDPVIFKEISAILRDDREMEKIFTEVQASNDFLTDSVVFTMYKELYVALGSIEEQMTKLHVAIYEDLDHLEKIEFIEKQEAFEERAKEQQWQRADNI